MVGVEEIAAVVRLRVASDFGGAEAAHDLAHLDRVHRLAQALSYEEGGDREVLAAAAYLHDLHRVLEREAADGRAIPAGEAEALVREHLDTGGVLADRVDRVVECVAFTDRHTFAGHDAAHASLEARILSDADGLDAMGAVGVARAFMYGGHLGEPMWDPSVPVGNGYVPGRASSVIHHFYDKLLRLRDDMRTPAGRRHAEERHAFLEAFLERFHAEWADGDPVQRRPGTTSPVS